MEWFATIPAPTPGPLVAYECERSKILTLTCEHWSLGNESVGHMSVRRIPQESAKVDDAQHPVCIQQQFDMCANEEGKDVEAQSMDGPAEISREIISIFIIPFE